MDESDPAADVLPLGQSAHDVRSERSYVPAEHVEQLVRELVPCLPAGQVIHELWPALGWYLPAAQVLHEVLVWLEDDWDCRAKHEEQPLDVRNWPLPHGAAEQSMPTVSESTQLSV